MCALLPNVCHLMSLASTSFSPAEQPVITLQMATSAFSLSLSVHHTHVHTVVFSLPITSKAANLASLESLPLWLTLPSALDLCATVGLLIVFCSIPSPGPNPSPTLAEVQTLKRSHFHEPSMQTKSKANKSNGWSRKFTQTNCWPI